MKIAITGKSGCGNSTTSRRVANMLGIPMINYTFRTLAEERGMSFDELRRLAEEDSSWDLYVDKRQVQMAREAGSCVLGSRLAIWMLPEADLRVYLWAPVEVRAARVQKREGGDYAEVLRLTNERDQLDRERYMKLYSIDNDDYGFTDLIVDTTSRTQQEVAEIIVGEIRARFGLEEVRAE